MKYQEIILHSIWNTITWLGIYPEKIFFIDYAKIFNNKLTGLCIYILITVIMKVTQGTFHCFTFQTPWRWVPAAHPAECSLWGWLCCVRLGFEYMLFPPTLLFQPFTELASTAEKPQLKEEVLCEQDTAAQFGPQKEPVRQQIHRMFLLRVKLMHFVNSLHNYIMTRVRVCVSASVLSPCIQLFIENYLWYIYKYKGAHKILLDYKYENSTHKKFDHKITWQQGEFFLNIPEHVCPETAAPPVQWPLGTGTPRAPLFELPSEFAA